MNTITNNQIIYSPRTSVALAGQRIRHPRIADTIEECRLMLAAGSNANLILVCGPTGVGKSTLGEFLVEVELKDQVAELTGRCKTQ